VPDYPKNFNADRAATILVDAAYLGDPRAAEKWKVTTRTIENYRARLKSDPHFSALFATKRAAAEGNWKHELGRALTTSIRKLAALIENTDPTILSTPAAIEAVTGAVKALSEIAITGEVLNAGNAHPSAGDPTPRSSVASGTATA
jgi:hypothetical protein